MGGEEREKNIVCYSEAEKGKEKVILEKKRNETCAGQKKGEIEKEQK